MHWLLNGPIGCALLAAMTTAAPTPDAQVSGLRQKFADGMSAGYEWVSDKAGWNQAPPQRAYCVTQAAYGTCEQYYTLERLERVVGQVTRRIGMPINSKEECYRQHAAENGACRFTEKRKPEQDAQLACTIDCEVPCKKSGPRSSQCNLCEIAKVRALCYQKILPERAFYQSQPSDPRKPPLFINKPTADDYGAP